MTGSISRPPRQVSGSKATVLSYRVLLRQIVTPGRIFALALVGLTMVIVGLSVGLAAEGGTRAEDRLADGFEMVDQLGLVVIVPVVTLVFAVAVLANAREDGTLVYLWLRPMDRSPVVIGAVLAVITVALPLTVIPNVVGGWLVTSNSAGSVDLAWGALVAVSLGTLAYTALFVLLGLLAKKAILVAIGYVLIWEGLVAGFGTFAARLSVRGYTRSILLSISGADSDVDVVSSTATAVVALVVITVAAIGLATVRLKRLDVA